MDRSRVGLIVFFAIHFRYQGCHKEKGRGGAGRSPGGITSRNPLERRPGQAIFVTKKRKGMKTFAIVYELMENSGHNYSRMYEEIRRIAGIPNQSHLMEPMWVIKTSDDMTANEIFTRIRCLMYDGDILFVTEMAGDSEGWIPKSFWSWLKEERREEKPSPSA